MSTHWGMNCFVEKQTAAAQSAATTPTQASLSTCMCSDGIFQNRLNLMEGAKPLPQNKFSDQIGSNGRGEAPNPKTNFQIRLDLMEGAKPPKQKRPPSPKRGTGTGLGGAAHGKYHSPAAGGPY